MKEFRKISQKYFIMNVRCQLVIIIFFVSGLLSEAQTDSIKHIFAGLHAHYGFIIPHSIIIEPVSYSNPYGILFDIGSLSRSYNRWKVFNSWWTAGIQTGYFSFDNHDTLGGAFMLTGFAEPVLARGKRFIMVVRGGGGVSYHTRIYNEFSNPSNQFFCTRISFPVYLALRFKYSIFKGTYLTFSGFYNHISNGGVKQPNYGMNYPTVSFGIEYYKPELSLERIYISDTRVKEKGVNVIAGILAAYKVVDRTEIYPEKGTISYGLYIRGLKLLRSWYS
ncbi:MAG: acyloxyacyl hydrolase, partial [Bacteroidales bacterium]